MKQFCEEGIILQLQGFSVNDGDGVRTVIFMAGCPLRCKWCANPETWDLEPKLVIYDNKCTRCGKCADACPRRLFPPGMVKQCEFGASCELNRICASVCPNGAIAVLCEKMSVEQVVQKAERDEVFYRHSGGGVTFSGGEPTVQQGFLRAAVNRFYKRGISVWIETCGYFKWEGVKDILMLTEHVFCDIKFIDAGMHKQYTGADNGIILKNCVKMHEAGIPVTIRLPSLKDVNFTFENLNRTAAFMRDKLPGARIELLPYHRLGIEKYNALRMSGFINEFVTPSADDISEAYELFRGYGIEPVEYR